MLYNKKLFLIAALYCSAQQIQAATLQEIVKAAYPQGFGVWMKAYKDATWNVDGQLWRILNPVIDSNRNKQVGSTTDVSFLLDFVQNQILPLVNDPELPLHRFWLSHRAWEILATATDVNGTFLNGASDAVKQSYATLKLSAKTLKDQVIEAERNKTDIEAGIRQILSIEELTIPELTKLNAYLGTFYRSGEPFDDTMNIKKDQRKFVYSILNQYMGLEPATLVKPVNDKSGYELKGLLTLLDLVRKTTLLYPGSWGDFVTKYWNPVLAKIKTVEEAPVDQAFIDEVQKAFNAEGLSLDKKIGSINTKLAEYRKSGLFLSNPTRTALFAFVQSSITPQIQASSVFLDNLSSIYFLNTLIGYDFLIETDRASMIKVKDTVYAKIDQIRKSLTGTTDLRTVVDPIMSQDIMLALRIKQLTEAISKIFSTGEPFGIGQQTYLATEFEKIAEEINNDDYVALMQLRPCIGISLNAGIIMNEKALVQQLQTVMSSLNSRVAAAQAKINTLTESIATLVNLEPDEIMSKIKPLISTSCYGGFMYRNTNLCINAMFKKAVDTQDFNLLTRIRSFISEISSYPMFIWNNSLAGYNDEHNRWMLHNITQKLPNDRKIEAIQLILADANFKEEGIANTINTTIQNLFKAIQKGEISLSTEIHQLIALVQPHPLFAKYKYDYTAILDALKETTPAPVASTPAPVVSAPTPVAPTPAPVVSAPTPVAPAELVRAPAPVPTETVSPAVSRESSTSITTRSSSSTPTAPASSAPARSSSSTSRSSGVTSSTTLSTPTASASSAPARSSSSTSRSSGVTSSATSSTPTASASSSPARSSSSTSRSSGVTSSATSSTPTASASSSPARSSGSTTSRR